MPPKRKVAQNAPAIPKSKKADQKSSPSKSSLTPNTPTPAATARTTLPDLHALLADLQADPVRHVNHIRRLLAAIDPTASFTRAHVSAEALRGLRHFFLGALAKNPSLIATAAATDASPYDRFVAKGLAQFKVAACEALAIASEAGIQVAALNALMELVRSLRVGHFADELFSTTVRAMVTSPRLTPECAGLFAKKYLPHADVRYFTLKTLEKIAGSGWRRSGGGEEEREEKVSSTTCTPCNTTNTPNQKTDDGISTSARRTSSISTPTSTSTFTSEEDVARNAFDILSLVSPTLPGDPSHWISWSEAMEGGKVAPAATGKESKAKRRKRQGEESGGGEDGKSGDAGASFPFPVARVRWASPESQTSVFSSAWLSMLRSALPRDITRKVLHTVHTKLIPHLSSPLLLSDYLSSALDQGGIDAILALHGIFKLITEHGLEYSRFYERVYGLLTPTAFLLKERATFFQLVDVFLMSAMVPAYTAAAFVKRFARLALTAPPHGTMICLAFIHNLIRRHPACNVLFHRVVEDTTNHKDQGWGYMGEGDAPPPEEKMEKEKNKTKTAVVVGRDPYDPSVTDPALARAAKSSLWEIQALGSHWCPQVAQFARMLLAKDLTDRRKVSEADLEPLLGGGFGQLYRLEVERKIKTVVPTAFYGSVEGQGPRYLHHEDETGVGGDFCAFVE